MTSRNPTFLNRLQAMFNLIIGPTAAHALPDAFREPTPWERNAEILQRPAVWRRMCQVR
jgi:hypothetical protein